MNPNDVGPMIITAILTIAVTTLLIVRMVTRAKTPLASGELKEIATRLERMEQAIDAMAVETERISEAQRFTTKLLSDKSAARMEPR